MLAEKNTTSCRVVFVLTFTFLGCVMLGKNTTQKHDLPPLPLNGVWNVILSVPNVTLISTLDKCINHNKHISKRCIEVKFGIILKFIYLFTFL